jgi:YfiH family protein
MFASDAPSQSIRRSALGVESVFVPAWERFDWLWHGFSTRRSGVSRAYRPANSSASEQQGDLNLGFTPADDREAVIENRERFAAALSGSGQTPLILVRQIHSNCSVTAPDAPFASDAIPAADGLMTDGAGTLIGVQTADCIPVLVVDPAHRAVAAFHAGWRGTVERIVELGVAGMRTEFGSDPAQLLAAIGPGIGACCYTVGGEVRERFGANFHYAEDLFTDGGEVGASGTAEQQPSGMRLDLIEANRRQLLDAGLAAEAIAVVGGCTSCQPELFFSHRASGGHAGRMIAAIGVRAES